ncbi:alpha/beta fold hydrolase [Altererythrobacter aerius]|uniref:Alpha/beta fold hydrolase n=1 Tax=Tsuneonella aeria TaxID=1837929 RepID=A0A6I4T8T5_9SPHN|nr:alpha/beta fold hydrolase [Tsuneonella aeria]MXO73731.1 alpha/beta fold hydrolase [Tsuneonella aeria]
MNERPDAPRPAPLGMYGTDANLAPSPPDAVLRYASHPRGIAELRVPAGEGPFPMAVIFHGGCWKTGIADQNYMAPLATRWQQQGIATLNVDYREVGDGGGWPGSFADWRDAAGLIDQVARRHPIDRARVTLVGHSAGALPALWLPGPEGEGGPLPGRNALTARAAIVLDGPASVGREQPAFDALCEFSSVGPFLGDDGRGNAIAPRPMLREILFVQARLPAPPAASLAEAGAGGARVVVRTNPGVSHFAIITPGDPAYAANEAAIIAVLQGR